MKKLFLSLIIIAVATQLKAQQTTVKPFDQNLFNLPKDQSLQQFKLGDSALLKGFSVLPKEQLLAVPPYKLPDYNMLAANPVMNIDHMPVLKVSGNIDHMPIVKMSGNIEKMPVAKVARLGLLKPVTP